MVVQERRILRSTRLDPLVTEDESDLTPIEESDDEQQPRTRRKESAENDQVQRQAGQAKYSGTCKRTQVSETGSEAPPKKRKRACKPEPVYIIPGVEKKATTFRGRLGANDFEAPSLLLILLRRLRLFKYRPAQLKARERGDLLFQDMSVRRVIMERNSVSHLTV